MRTERTKGAAKVGMIITNPNAPVLCYQDLILGVFHKLAYVAFLIHTSIVTDDAADIIPLQPSGSRNKLTEVNLIKTKMLPKLYVFKSIFTSINSVWLDLVNLTTKQVETFFGELEYIEPRLRALGYYRADINAKTAVGLKVFKSHCSPPNI
jgi:hypothetical protein